MWVESIPWGALHERGRWTAGRYREAPESPGRWAWPERPLGDVAQMRRQRLQPADWPEHRFCYLGLENVASQSGLLVGECTALGADVRSRSKVFRRGDVLYGRLRPYLNKVHAVVEDAREGICSNEFVVLVPDPDRVDPLFLRELLASSVIQDRVADLQAGSALPRLRGDDLLRLEVPMPPRTEQRILAEELRGERARLRRDQSEVERRPAAVRSAFEDALAGGRFSVEITPEEARTLPDLPPDAPPSEPAPPPRSTAGGR